MNNNLQHLIKIYETIQRATGEHYRQAGLTYVDVPSIVGITGACENVDTLFRVKSRVDVPLFFSQTGQLSLEQALQYVPGVWTVIHSGRDEEAEDERHLRQFRLIEEEFDWSLAGSGSYEEEKMYEALLVHIENAVKAIGRAVLGEHGGMLASVFGRDTGELKINLEEPFGRITYDETVELLRRSGFPELEWGDDLKAEHEAKAVELLGKKPVFIMRYPKEIKFFNMKVSAEDPRVVLSTDLVFPYAGEGVGSAVREHDGGKLKERLLGSTMFRLHKERGGDLEDFRWYLDLVTSARTNPHAGYGIGCERVAQYLLGVPDIRTGSLFAALAAQTKDWLPRSRKAQLTR